MISRIRFGVISALVLIGCSVPGRASLIGTTVTGSLLFQGHPLNYFDPANGFVPATGYENSSGTTVTIAEPAIEFGAVFPGTNTDTADFTATQLILTDIVNSPGSNVPFMVTFTDTGLLGLTLAKISDTFADGGTSVSLAGDVLTVSWNGGQVNTGTLQAVYGLTAVSVPEPSSWALLLVGAGTALGAQLLRKSGE